MGILAIIFGAISIGKINNNLGKYSGMGYAIAALSSKEIASIFGISPKSVDMNRYRLRKKMQLDNNEDINKVLNQLA